MKRKVYPPKNLMPTPIDTFSPFNLKNLKTHSESVDLDVDLLRDIQQQVINLAQKRKLHPLEIVQTYFDLLQISVVEFYEVEHAAPKMFMLGLTLLKCSHQLAEGIAVNNGIVSSMNNLKIIKDKLQTIASEYNLDYDKLPSMTKNTGLNSN